MACLLVGFQAHGSVKLLHFFFAQVSEKTRPQLSIPQRAYGHANEALHRMLHSPEKLSHLMGFPLTHHHSPPGI
jgi:hypothetical protein